MSLQGLTGGESLLRDIETLEYQRFKKDDRRMYPLMKIFSLANAFPLEFQAYKATGALWFRTDEIDFDRDFPGHYYRQIRSIRLEVYALVGIEGIKAPLIHLGPSEIVVNEPVGHRTHLLPGEFEKLTLAGSPDGRGYVVLNPVGEERLNPFEGKGVAGSWLLELPKHANAIEYETITDVIFMVEYASFYDDAYRKEVTERLQSQVWIGSRAIRARINLPDGFYHLTNPSTCGPQHTTSVPLNLTTIQIPLDRNLYPPNQDERVLDGLILAFTNSTGESLEFNSVELMVATRSHVEQLWHNGRVKCEQLPNRKTGSTWMERGGELVDVHENKVMPGARSYSGKWLRVLRRGRLVWIPETDWKTPGDANEGILASEIDFTKDENEMPREEVPAELLREAQVKMRYRSVNVVDRKRGKLTKY